MCCFVFFFPFVSGSRVVTRLVHYVFQISLNRIRLQYDNTAVHPILGQILNNGICVSRCGMVSVWHVRCRNRVSSRDHSSATDQRTTALPLSPPPPPTTTTTTIATATTNSIQATLIWHIHSKQNRILSEEKCIVRRNYADEDETNRVMK